MSARHGPRRGDSEQAPANTIVYSLVYDTSQDKWITKMTQPNRNTYLVFEPGRPRLAQTIDGMEP